MFDLTIEVKDIQLINDSENFSTRIFFAERHLRHHGGF